MHNQPDICIDAHRPEIRVYGTVQPMEMQPPAGRIELQVECRRLDGLLLRTGQPYEACCKGIGDAELHPIALERHLIWPQS